MTFACDGKIFITVAAWIDDIVYKKYILKFFMCGCREWVVWMHYANSYFLSKQKQEMNSLLPTWTKRKPAQQRKSYLLQGLPIRMTWIDTKGVETTSDKGVPKGSTNTRLWSCSYLLGIVGEVWHLRGVHTVQLTVQNIETKVTHVGNSHRFLIPVYRTLDTITIWVV